MKPSTVIAAFGTVMSPLILGSCAFAEHSRYQAAEAEYRECLDANPRNPDACEPLRAARDQAYETYEQTAERAWGCDRSIEGCDADSLPNGPH